jgi:hypothetical protein
MKTMRRVTGAALALALAWAPASTAGQPAAAKAEAGKPMVLNFKGTAKAEPKKVTLEGKQQEAKCFTTDLIDLSRNEVVGKGTDCLVVKPDDKYAGFEVMAQTTFDFGNGDTFVTQGRTSVQPKTHGLADFTHITGAMPPEGENTLVKATGRFKGLEANVRLSGLVDMSKMKSQDQVRFDCLFVVEPLTGTGGSGTPKKD